MPARHSAWSPAAVVSRTRGTRGTPAVPEPLPPGIRLEGDRLFVDLRQLLERAGYGDLVPLIERLHLATDEGRLLVEVEARV